MFLKGPKTKIKDKFLDNVTLESIGEAFKNTYKHSKKYRRDIMYFKHCLNVEIYSIYNELKNKTYNPQGYRHFNRLERGKVRELHQPTFRDLVIQRLIQDFLYEKLKNHLYSSTFGSLKGTGPYHSCEMCKHYIASAFEENKDLFYIQFDIKRFYENINKDLLKKILGSYFEDTYLVELVMKFYLDGHGVPLGNLISGIVGILFLTPLDFYVKRKLKIKRYIRYVDDFVLIGVEKEKISYYINEIENFIDSMKLKCHEPVIDKCKNGVNFTGSTNKPYIRKQRIRNLKSARRNHLAGKISIIGHSKGTVDISKAGNFIFKDPALPFYNILRDLAITYVTRRLSQREQIILFLKTFTIPF